MENEKLINELKAVGFHNVTPMMLAKEVRTGHSVIVESYEDKSLMIANCYYDENHSIEWRKHPVFRGFIETKEDMVKFATVLNLEPEGREAFYALTNF